VPKSGVFTGAANSKGHPPGTKPGDLIHFFQGGTIQIPTIASIDPAGNVWVANNWNSVEAATSADPSRPTSTWGGGSGFTVIYGVGPGQHHNSTTQTGVSPDIVIAVDRYAPACIDIPATVEAFRRWLGAVGADHHHHSGLLAFSLALLQGVQDERKLLQSRDVSDFHGHGYCGDETKSKRASR
jgi:hypothetical protein